MIRGLPSILSLLFFFLFFLLFLQQGLTHSRMLNCTCVSCFLAVPWVYLQFVAVVFPDYTYYFQRIV